jgi:hypothetical protein
MIAVALGGAPSVSAAAIDPFTLIVLLFIALPILQGVFGKKQREEQRRRQQQRRTQQGQASSSAGMQTRERREENAADLVPDDLWELLTGERRQRTRDQIPTREWGAPAQDAPTSQAPVATEPEPEWEAIPEPAPYEPVSDEAEESGHPWRVSDKPTPMVPRRERSDNLPEAVSMEQPVRYDDAQERAFHRELAHLPPPARAHRRGRLRYGLGHNEDLRRAFILKEILGPPKGL